MTCGKHPYAKHDEELGCYGCWFRAQPEDDPDTETRFCKYMECGQEFTVTLRYGRSAEYCCRDHKTKEDSRVRKERKEKLRAVDVQFFREVRA